MSVAHTDLFNGCSYELGGLIRFGNSMIVMDAIRRLAFDGFMQSISIVIEQIFVQEANKAHLARYKEQTEKLVFQRLKEPFDFSVRLRMPDRGLDMADVRRRSELFERCRDNG